jgi:hypothetical protein
MKKIEEIFLCILLIAPNSSLRAGTGRPEDGFLFFIVLLGFLGLILGIIYIGELILFLIRVFRKDYFSFLG